ncbi:E3 ubiquitin-protein ligase AMFR [Rhinichthys klamathensis goyatoka]|uniref:E3 ubiquitin-protein ligase AMFR n=1 Tax=Rhinichthys klamathensis goyatoka TaxID=3034132 RepID=UPI0024B4A9EC|nr:E3 ubiquitin-protein ligase AMFR [Rhinichthys klamathensis goyatoka]
MAEGGEGGRLLQALSKLAKMPLRRFRYTIHLYDLICEDFWEDKEVCIYYTDFVMEMGILFLDMMHHIHILLYGNIWFSVADLIILTDLRFLSQEMQHKLLQHKNYLHIYDVMDMKFSMATMEELASHDDRCAVCWEKMYTAYKLPCGHLFHKYENYHNSDREGFIIHPPWVLNVNVISHAALS